MKADIKEIAKRVQKIIDDEVVTLKHDDSKWKSQYESVMSELESELKAINAGIEQFKESNLNFNVIEQEGYRRCLITMLDRFRYFEKFL